jgi:hypothetical protein
MCRLIFILSIEGAPMASANDVCPRLGRRKPEQSGIQGSLIIWRALLRLSAGRAGEDQLPAGRRVDATTGTHLVSSASLADASEARSSQ